MPSQNVQRKKVFLCAASVITPGASNLKEFLHLIKTGQCALKPKESMANAFLAGTPKFDFSRYQEWIEKRHGAKRFALLSEKSGDLVKYGVGSLIDAISSQPEIENAITSLDPRVTVQYANGLADLPIIHKSAREYDTACFTWYAFWADPVRNIPHQDYQTQKCKDQFQGLPVNPKDLPVDSLERYTALLNWNKFWTSHSPLFQEYLKELKSIECLPLKDKDIENAKLFLIRHKAKARKELQNKYQHPTPPWEGVSPNLLWNIPNIAASQVSMLLNIHGASSGYSGACASFGGLVDNALQDLISGRTDLAIIGAVDAEPSDELISAFYSAKLAVLGDSPGIPFCTLQGTHISGGACTWILATEEAIQKFGIRSLGIEILGTGVSSDAEHIITPSATGPKLAILRSLEMAGVLPEQIHLWDMHATGTPGDWNEFALIEDIVPESAFISARKGIFGHGMSASGGWELTAQLLGVEKIKEGTVSLLPSGIFADSLNPKIALLKRNILFNVPVEIPFPDEGLFCGKLGLGVGGLASCVIAKIHSPMSSC